jgi:hypothetical protein
MSNRKFIIDNESDDDYHFIDRAIEFENKLSKTICNRKINIEESTITFSSWFKMPNQNKQSVINLHASNNLETIYLNDSKSSWIKLLKLSDQDGLSLSEFEELWNLKPADKLKIKIAGKIIECPRYSKSYLQCYKFSGLNHEADLNLPNRIDRLFNEFAKKLNPDLNQSLVNWYESNGSIGKHSDDTRQLKHNSEIFSFSFGPAKRSFILESRNDITKYNIQLDHNTLIIMGGECQKTHCHSVPKKYDSITNSLNERRLNVTFRCFK